MSDNIPDYCEPIQAWRFWFISRDKDENSLSSSYYTTWEPYKALEARHLDYPGLDGFGFIKCIQSPCKIHIPYQKPGCGIYGFKTFDHLICYTNDYSKYVGMIIGAVNLWGRIVEHQYGYRGQFAYPAKLVWSDNLDQLKSLAKKYGIPYEENEELKWKLDYRRKSLYRNHSAFQSPSLSIQTPLKVGQIQNLPIMSQLSQYLYPPSSLSLIKKPKFKIHKQPSFTIHKPIDWFYNKNQKLWVRVTEID